jgi:hypothetical protein
LYKINYFNDGMFNLYISSSLGARFLRFISSKRKNLKEAGKIFEYTTVVERGLQSAEILKAIAEPKPKLRAKYLSDAGLVEEQRSTITSGKLSCLVSVLRPLRTNLTDASTSDNATTNAGYDHVRGVKLTTKAIRAEIRKKQSIRPLFYPDELIVAVTEANEDSRTSIANLLLQLVKDARRAVYVPTIRKETVDASELLGSNLKVQPTILELSLLLLQNISHIIEKADGLSLLSGDTRLPSVSQSSSRVMNKTNSTNSATQSSPNFFSTSTLASASASASDSGSDFTSAPPKRLRFVGYSVGGAVASLAAVVLDGGVMANCSDSSGELLGAVKMASTAGLPLTTAAPSGLQDGGRGRGRGRGRSLAKQRSSSTQRSASATGTVVATNALNEPLQQISSLIGAYQNSVNCIALGPPPCMSRTHIPRYIMSVVCGDDVVPRARAPALHALRERVVQALQAGAGFGSAGGGVGGAVGKWKYLLNAGMFTDLKTLAGSVFFLFIFSSFFYLRKVNQLLHFPALCMSGKGLGNYRGMAL